MPDAIVDDPYPPLPLMNRVGSLASASDPHAWYDRLGAGAKASIVGALPADWTWEGKRVLDFGCGAGRTLRHFRDEAAVAQISGCDIDTESIDWLQANLVPPLATVVASGAEPPLPFEDDSFDLVYAVSVFTHLSTHWAPWLIEMHRVLAPGGLLVATFIGEAVAESINGEPWDEARIGVSISNDGQSWDLGGPMVVHSPWWLRAHWGRLFAIDRIQPYGFGAEPGKFEGHGIVVARKDDRPAVAVEDLAPPAEPDLAAEAAWLHLEVQRRLTEIRNLRYGLDQATASLAAAQDQLARAEAEPAPAAPPPELEQLRDQRDRLEARVRELETSTSWRVTKPLRAGADAVRARRAAKH